jgi:ankyrin repeat protein
MANLIVRFESAHLVTSILDNWQDDTIIKTQLDRRYGHGSSLLLTAASVGNDANVQFLLERGAILESTDSNGDTALTAAICRGCETTTRLLLDHGIDLEQNTTSSHGRSALLCAVAMDNEAITRLLLEKGANMEAKNHYGETPLFAAAVNNNEPIARLLLEKGADPNVGDEDGCSPLNLMSDELKRKLGLSDAEDDSPKAEDNQELEV